jgi:hypothetical protein
MLDVGCCAAIKDRKVHAKGEKVLSMSKIMYQEFGLKK